MQDKDFDRFIREALENQAEPAYNPGDWDMLEDRLHQFQMPQTNPGAGASGAVSGGLAKLGFVASTVLFTALNAVNMVQPDIFGSATQKVEKTSPVTSEMLAAEIAATNEQAPANEFSEEAISAETLEQASPAKGTQAETPVVASQAQKLVNTNGKRAGKSSSRAGNSKLSVSGNTAAFNGNAYSGTALQNSGSQNGMLNAGKPAAGGTVAGAECIGNTKPEMISVLKGADTLRTNRITISTCETLALNLTARDKEADKINITSNVANVLPGARLQVSENGTAQVLWNARPGIVRDYNFTLWLADSRCPNAEPRAYNYTINVVPGFTASVVGTAKIERGQIANLEVNGAPQGSTFKWLTQDGIVNDGKSAYIDVKPLQTTIYKVQIISPKGCIFTDSVKVEVMQPEPVIPNAITPGNDGKNDYFEVILPGDEPIHLEIFDLRGKQVYSRDNYSNTWNAEGLPAGTYNYFLKQKDRTYKGWVEVIR